ncbi:hypothetical protein KHA80_04040 [Anaerobacillus sp. HL2]|nr:hypothetical protein KHA80_04040 [Anaerobacillus sp. HL2]
MFIFNTFVRKPFGNWARPWIIGKTYLRKRAFAENSRKEQEEVLSGLWFKNSGEKERS